MLLNQVIHFPGRHLSSSLASVTTRGILPFVWPEMTWGAVVRVPLLQV
jgi:hypothetical protein